jgi:S1-C subfamily serine protease
LLSPGGGANPGQSFPGVVVPGGTGTASGAIGRAANALVDINTVLGFAQGEAAGTGIVLTSSGYVLTNNHVISGATDIKATDVGDGRTYSATVVGYDRVHDVALIKLQGASDLATAHIGNSSAAAIGEPVVGLGNAGGLGGSPSTAPGHITALNQSITAQDQGTGTSEKLTGLIQTNSDIQPGDSGGALVDSSGNVLGMVTAASASTGFSFSAPPSQGFAIPINQAVYISNLIRSGSTAGDIHLGPTAFLGVEVDISAAAAGTQGATIRSTIAGEPAAAAGIGAGDVITSLGGATIDSANALTDQINRYHPGDRVTVGWTAPNGTTHTATITLAKGPAA